jgi:hypothetical protein
VTSARLAGAGVDAGAGRSLLGHAESQLLGLVSFAAGAAGELYLALASYQGGGLAILRTLTPR